MKIDSDFAKFEAEHARLHAWGLRGLREERKLIIYNSIGIAFNVLWAALCLLVPPVGYVGLVNVVLGVFHWHLIQQGRIRIRTQRTMLRNLDETLAQLRAMRKALSP